MYMGPIVAATPAVPAAPPLLRAAAGMPVLLLAAALMLPWLLVAALIAAPVAIARVAAKAPRRGWDMIDYAGRVALGR